MSVHSPQMFHAEKSVAWPCKWLNITVHRAIIACKLLCKITYLCVSNLSTKYVYFPVGWPSEFCSSDWLIQNNERYRILRCVFFIITRSTLHTAKQQINSALCAKKLIFRWQNAEKSVGPLIFAWHLMCFLTTVHTALVLCKLAVSVSQILYVHRVCICTELKITKVISFELSHVQNITLLANKYSSLVAEYVVSHENYSWIELFALLYYCLLLKYVQ